jgi:hypothetical protein
VTDYDADTLRLNRASVAIRTRCASTDDGECMMARSQLAWNAARSWHFAESSRCAAALAAKHREMLLTTTRPVVPPHGFTREARGELTTVCRRPATVDDPQRAWDLNVAHCSCLSNMSRSSIRSGVFSVCRRSVARSGMAVVLNARTPGGDLPLDSFRSPSNGSVDQWPHVRCY